MPNPRRPASLPAGSFPDELGRETELRIIGGVFRGRRLRYHGDPVVRPMKHRVREAIFNLISTVSDGACAIDLFAGTGALGLEALSRGARRALFIERHVPTAQVLQENVATLNVADRTSLLVTSAFLWSKRDLPTFAAEPSHSTSPWLAFCSPPYAFFIDRKPDMLDLINRLRQVAPPRSTIVVESDDRFDTAQLMRDNNWTWDVRGYPPAVVAVGRHVDI
jgi:16S rRNA (guanine966-N2)-methyltransferase